jgi:hypothetical protein
MEIAYDMSINHFQLISKSSLSLLMKKAYSLYENSLTFFFAIEIAYT